jgi:hypothetical protein
MDWYDIVENGSPEYGITAEDMADKIFDISIDMAPTDQDRQYIEGMAQTAVTAGIITFEESVKIRRIAKEDVKLAEIYLAKYESKRKRQAQDEAKQNSMVQAQIQDQVAQSKAQADAQLLQGKAAVDMQKQSMVNDASKTQIMGTVVNTILGEWMKQGKPMSELPPEFSMMISSFMENVVGAQQLQVMQNQQQAQAMQQQEQQEAQEQQQMEQQQGQM